NLPNRSSPTAQCVSACQLTNHHRPCFGACRNARQQSTRQFAAPVNTSYPFTDNQDRYEGKLTYSVNSNHRFQGAYTKIIRSFINNGGNQFLVLDQNSLFNSSQPADLVALNYNGVLSPTFFVEARFTKRHGITSGA